MLISEKYIFLKLVLQIFLKTNLSENPVLKSGPITDKKRFKGHFEDFSKTPTWVCEVDISAHSEPLFARISREYKDLIRFRCR